MSETRMLVFSWCGSFHYYLMWTTRALIRLRIHAGWSVPMMCAHTKSRYRKVPKFWDARNLCCNLPKIETKRPNLKRILSKWCKWNSNQWRPWSDCSWRRSSLIWVCTVCPDLSIRKLRVITVFSWGGSNPGSTFWSSCLLHSHFTSALQFQKSDLKISYKVMNL